jgi:hypothetical protein
MEDPIISTHWFFRATREGEDTPTYEFTLIEPIINSEEPGAGADKAGKIAYQITGIDPYDYTWQWNIGDGGPYYPTLQQQALGHLKHLLWLREEKS